MPKKTAAQEVAKESDSQNKPSSAGTASLVLREPDDRSELQQEVNTKDPTRKKSARKSLKKPQSSRKTAGDPLSIVGIGASAGGLAALKTFFSHVPDDSGLAYVVVVHLSPEHKSHLAELLQPHVNMPVEQVSKTVKLERNHVYVIPPGANLDTIDTHLRLTDLEARRQERAPIDHFFRTLAKTHDGEAIGVILSGTGSDGTLGLREIKQGGGPCIVQDPAEAEYDGMPQNAIATGIVDVVLPVAQIPQAILRIVRTQPRVPKGGDGEELDGDTRNLLQKVFAQIRARTGRDFTRYKRSTILRRIERRMQIRHIEETTDYLELLRTDPEEVRTLGDDLLINVTSFFRDPTIFEKLEAETIPALFKGKGADDEIRVWSVGCATGEEAYSLAIVLLEQANRQEIAPRIQVFASDLHEHSLKKARDGFYPGDIETEVSPERLKRFFVKETGGYRIRRELREVVVFAPHNLLGDPPFSRLDLISCRNLLIYIQREVQRDIVELFHYALKAEGYLLLGTSETIDTSELFRIVDKQRAIYQKRNVPAPEPRLPVFPLTHHRLPRDPEGHDQAGERIAYGPLHQRMVEQYAPPSALISRDDKVVHLSENAGRYLLNAGGEPTLNIFKLVRKELQVELRTVLHIARSQREAVDSRPVQVRFNGDTGFVSLHVRPSLEPNQEGFVLVIFEERKTIALSPPDEVHNREPMAATKRDAAEGRAHELGAELEQTRQQLQAIIEEHDTSQEEMRASHEEMQSTNEELRSTMEELETSKEELQSMNEELQAVNQENRHKVEELSQLSGDLQNLMAATDIATLFLDRDLRILRFTPKVGELFNVRITDRGRPLADLTHRLGHATLIDDAAQALKKLIPIEREIADESGRWYLTRVMPYRSADDRIDGVVITFVDISDLKQAEQQLAEAKEYAEKIVETLHEPLLVLNPDFTVKSCNPAFFQHFQVRPEQAHGRMVYDLGNGQWNIPALRELLEDVLPTNAAFKDFEVRHEFDDLGERVMLVNARRLDHVQLILLGIRDITDRKMLEDELRKVAGDLADANRRKDEFLATLAHEIRNPLACIRSGLELMKISGGDADLVTEVRQTMERQTEQLVRLIDDLLDVSRITCGKLELRKCRTQLKDVVRNAVEASRPAIDQAGHDLSVSVPEQPVVMDADPHRLTQVLSNLLSNAARYTPRGGRIWLTAEQQGRNAVISVKDTGVGIPLEMQSQIFEMFTQVRSSGSDSGLGIGLTLVKSLVELHGGSIEVESAGTHQGATVTIRLPVIVDGAVEDAEPSPAEAMDLSGLRILVVDDSKAAADMLGMVIKGIGGDVRVAYNGQTAIEAAAEFQPQAILMDIGMPTLNGYEAARRIRKEPWGQDMTLIALTGWGQDEDKRRTQEAGFDHHLVKPLEPSALQQLLAEMKSKSR